MRKKSNPPVSIMKKKIKTQKYMLLLSFLNEIAEKEMKIK
jgi:hypothetical protein